MTNAEAITILKRAVAEVEWEYPMEVAAAIDKAIEALGGGWVSVKDGLPDEDTEVLVARYLIQHGKKKPYVETASRINDEWFSYTDEWKMDKKAHSKPYAWMQLPEPPKEET